MMDRCPNVKMDYLPKCIWCDEPHNWRVTPCKKKTAKDGGDKSKKECKSINYVNCSIRVPTTSPQTILTIDWSKLTSLDEMGATDSELPMKEVDLPFILPPLKQSSKPKPNRAAFFIRDGPKKPKNEKKDCDNNFNYYKRVIERAEVKKFSCDSGKCRHREHIKSTIDRSSCKDLSTNVLKRTQVDFPQSILATYDIDERKPDEISKPPKKQKGQPKGALLSGKNNSNNNKEKKKQLAEKPQEKVEETQVEVTKKKKVSKKGRKKKKKPPQCQDKVEKQTDKKEEEGDVVKINNYNPREDSQWSFAMEDLMCVNIRVGGSRTLKALLDTGSALTILIEKYLNEVGGHWKVAQTRIMGLGDKDGHDTLVSLVPKVIMEGILLNPCDFYCIPGVDIGHDVILGRDILESNNIRIFPAERKIKIGKLNSVGDKCTYSIIQQEAKSSINEEKENISCIQIPCYVEEDTLLESDFVNEVKIIPLMGQSVQQSVLENRKLVAYLEVKTNLTGKYPNFGIIRKSFDVQSIALIAGTDTILKSGTFIGYMQTSFVENLPERMAYDWIPKANAIYSIMSDQQVAEAINSAKKYNNSSQNPTAVLDKIPKFGTLPMKDTPPEFALGHHARIFPPRDMQLFNEQHEEWKRNPNRMAYPTNGPLRELSKTSFYLMDS